jgi:DNA-binding transcriptional LysR family regulator
MEIHHLRSFREVVRARSFTAAAKRLYLGQPAVSQQIKALETEVGERLLERTGRDVLLTPAGEILLEAVDRALSLLDDATKKIREARDAGEGTVTLACGDTVALYLLPPVLAEFRAKFPKADVSVRNHGSREIVALLLSGEADLGVATKPDDLDEALDSAPLLEESLLLALPPGHRLAATGATTLKDLEGEPAVLLARTAVTRRVIDEGLAAAGVRLSTAMESGNLEVCKAYVARGFGLSILPALAVTDDDRKRMAIHALPGDFPRRRLVVLRRRDRYRSRLVTALTALLAAHTKGLRPKARRTAPSGEGTRGSPRVEGSTP